ncbi:MAG: major facilitator transporter [Hyphomicrobiales bacterium]|nr:major facilitator transporter [Hyphomicrobiales bacterium]
MQTWVGASEAGDTRGKRLALALFLLLGGIVASAQLGKAIVAMPLLQAEMSLDITVVSLLIATFATLGATLGMGTGLVARRIGARRSLVGGMVVMAAGCVMGALAPGPALLMLSRIIEGVGFLGVVVVVPDLLNSVLTGRDRQLFFGMWGSFMPTGTALMLVLGPVLPSFGWRALWLTQAALTIAYAIAALALLPRDRPKPGVATSGFLTTARLVISDHASVLLALVFGLYAFQYFILAGFLPLILVGQLGLPIATASLFTAGVVAANALGNICAGILSRLGAPLWLNIAAAFGAYALTSPLIYSSGFPAGWVAVLAALALGLAGLAPGSVFAAVPRVVRPELVTPTIGLIQQTSNIGQFAGPVAAGVFVQYFGWGAVPLLLIPAAACGLAAALALRSRLTA